MGSYIVRRLIHAAFVLVILSVILFLAIQFSPGGPAVLVNPNVSAEDAARIRHNLGLDEPIHTQYLRWSWSLIQGDFGRSFIDGRLVSDVILERLPNTLLLSGAALFIAIVVGLSAGVIAATRPNSRVDHAVMFISTVGVSIPLFWLAIMSILLFSVKFQIFPSSGMSSASTSASILDRFHHLILPASVLSTVYVVQVARYMRSNMLEVLNQDYIQLAYAKGLGGWLVVTRHAIRNAIIPVVTVIGLMVPSLVGGAAITETIFSWPGMGRLAVDAAFRRDYPLIMGITMLFAVMVLVANLLVDLIYIWLDPRIRL